MMAAYTPKCKEDIFEIGTAAAIDGLHALWDKLNDSTTFRCHVDDVNFRFLFEVEDSTLTVKDFLEKETDVDVR